MRKFRISYNVSSYQPFKLCVSRERWYGRTWETVYTFETEAAARDHYALVKHLPVYL